jgi:hypothetical protein
MRLLCGVPPFRQSVFIAAIRDRAIGHRYLVSLRGSAVKLGLWGAVVFLLGVAPLAAADGFSAGLIKACAALLLLHFTHSAMLWSELAGLLAIIRTRTPPREVVGSSTALSFRPFMIGIASTFISVHSHEPVTGDECR